MCTAGIWSETTTTPKTKTTTRSTQQRTRTRTVLGRKWCGGDNQNRVQNLSWLLDTHWGTWRRHRPNVQKLISFQTPTTSTRTVLANQVWASLLIVVYVCCLCLLFMYVFFCYMMNQLSAHYSAFLQIASLVTITKNSIF